MRSTERHRLKENDLAETLASVREFVEPRKMQLGGLVVVVLLVVAAVAGVTIMRGRSSSQGDALLAEAMVVMNARVVPTTTPAGEPGDVPAAAQLGAEGSYATEEAKLKAALPKLKAAADAFPDSPNGITARYHMAGALAALGQYDEAVTAFEDVTRRAGGETLYGRMARLGKADTEAKAGKFDAAIATWKELAASNQEDLPKDAILMELARAYAAKGDQEEARKTFTQLVDEHPTSPYTAEARAELDQLKS